MTGLVARDAGLGNVTAVVLDVDGVVHVGGRGVPGAAGALHALRTAGMRLLFVTNNSTRTRQDVVDDVAQATGFAADAADAVTSSEATAFAMQGRFSTALVVGGIELAAALVERGIEVVEDWRRAEAVVVGLDRDLTYRRLTDATLAITHGAAFVATNTDATLPAQDGFHPGAGAIVAAISVASGAAPEVCGKPHPPVRRLVRSLVGEASVLVVGDRPETDVAMGKAEGWATALVLTGVVRRAQDVPTDLVPDIVVDSLADLPSAMGIAI
ncbi:MAG TPA: HAD-IIA family hydrolase [Acidimicrobiia bacterium]